MNRNFPLEIKLYIDFLNIIDDETLIDVIDNGSYFLKYVKNPSKKVQLAAIRININCLLDIKNPSEQVQLEAIKNDICSITYIEKPCESTQFFAIKNYDKEYDEEWFINNCLNKIQDSKMLNILYNKVQLPKSKLKITKSKSWKDYANLILEVINE